ncbi:MAG TPA: nucleoside triphosphate pyrophosphohydrolase [Thermoanaerobaculia bacterium]|nr:nucleoside triphosphate pyrophosphohydrolase [Thermoanaerobaculia bacterium]
MDRKSFDDLVRLMARLRAPGGCPWDREQTMETLRPFVIEEAYEVTHAIETGDREALREEVGDLLLQAVFISEIAREEGSFDVGDAVTSIHDKLVRRHPHVFADVDAKDAETVLTNWERLKSEERREKNEGVLSGVPAALPALLKAYRLTEKAARVGFDWQNPEDVFAKLDEEVGELREAIARKDEHQIEHELGDVLFTIVNVARKMGIDAEQALQRSNAKFIRRFEHVESRLREEGKSFDRTNLQEMDSFWNEARREDKE